MERFQKLMVRLEKALEITKKVNLAMIKIFYKALDAEVSASMIDNTLSVIKKHEELLKELKLMLQVQKNKKV